jgi:orotidine-5'-phosphate decarboxylase
MNDPRSRLIVALDLPDRASALSAVNALSGHVGYFKLGLEIFVREGPRLVEEIRDRGERIFLDLKLHDIPNTVAGAVASACHLRIHMLTLHAAGGEKMLRAALQAAEASAAPPLVLAVTALTSLALQDVERMGVRESVISWVEKLADIAHDSGIRGLVTSPLEVSLLRRKFGPHARLVVPGIRPRNTPSHDQSRTAEPAQAIRSGADFLVVGRPVLQDPNPAAAADRIVAEIGAALAQQAGPSSIP